MSTATRSVSALAAAVLLVALSSIEPVATVQASTAVSRDVTPREVAPVSDPGALPEPGDPAPLEPTEQRNACVASVPAGDSPSASAAQQDLNFASVWPLTRGAGQLVAVIDTGVAPHPRLPGLIAGGDYVARSASSSSGAGGDDTGGLSDCDAHGTLVAGLIAAHQVPGSGFAGGAPDATILSIRQSSGAFQSSERQPDNAGQNSSGYGNVMTMAMAVRTAADAGASVINISEVACVSAARGIVDTALGAAIHYAVHQKNVVVVAAAGNFGSAECTAQNPAPNLLDPAANPWDSVLTIATPAWFDDVLTVGSVGPDGLASPFSLAGPWVDVAAPGTFVTSLSPVGAGLTNGTIGSTGAVQPINGTSFAAPLVSATAALIRAYHPQLSALEVMHRIEATAHAPAEGCNPFVGHGVIDPLAAVTADIGDGVDANRFASDSLPLPHQPNAPDTSARTTAVRGLGTVVLMLAVGIAVSVPLRRRLHLTGRAADGSGPRPS